MILLLAAALGSGLLVLSSQAGGDPIIQWLSQGGGLGCMGGVIIGMIRGWIVTGREYDRVIEERDRAIDLMYRQAEVATRAIEAGEQIVK